MFKNYITLMLRNLLKQKFYSLINLFGLVIGLTASILILLYFADELSFDKMHSKSDRIFRVVEDRISSDKELKIPMTSGLVAPTLKNEYPEVENYVRLISRYTSGRFTVKYKENKFYEGHHYFADKTFFDVFDFDFLEGNKETALADPHNIVLTENTAQKFFGNEHPLGKIMTIERTGEFKVSAVLKNPPKNSHLNFEMLLPLSLLKSFKGWKNWIDSWKSDGIITYLVLKDKSDKQKINNAISNLISKKLDNDEGTKRRALIQSLSDIHFYSGDIEYDENSHKGNISYLYILGAVALFIILIASFNFVNLTTAQSERRAREIGMRKVLGADKSNLVKQFLSESLLHVFLAFLLSLILVQLLLPYFNSLTDKGISFDIFTNYNLLLGIILLVVLVGLFSGIYPAVYLSKYQPATVLKGTIQNSNKFGLRKLLVTAQFVISIGMIIATFIVYRQLQFIRDKNLGFNKENTIVVDINSGSTRSNYKSIKNEIKNIPSVKSVTVSSRVPGDWKNIAQIDANPEGQESSDPLNVSFISIDHDFLHSYNIKVLEGRNFYDHGDSANLIINRAAQKYFKWENPIGKRISIKDENYEGTVIGVVKDFNFKSLYEKVTPMILGYWNNPVQAIDYFSIKVNNEDISSTLQNLKNIHESFDKVTPFEFNFLDERLDDFYKTDQIMGKLFAISALLAVLIACLGLFALASYITKQRTKEIGIRKVLGASTSSIILMLSNEFVKLIFIAFALASPITYFLMKGWLSDFAYQTNTGLWIFLAAGFTSLLIAIISIGFQSVKASFNNPVDSLRNE